MNKILNLILYYILLLIGLSATSWIIYVRFIRERTIRSIPDSMLTELRFWVLLYICCIYLYAVTSLLSKKEGNIVIKELISLIYKPMVMLDHSIKYQRFIKPYYIGLMIYIISLLYKISVKALHTFIFMMQIFPRFILVIFLLTDTFYFHKIEIFYHLILIGLLPFILRYIKHSLKDFYEQMIKELENKYSSLLVYEKGFEPWKERLKKRGIRFFDDELDNERKVAPTAPYHNTKKTIKEFIEIDFENRFMHTDYSYDVTPFCKPEVHTQYVTEKFKGKDIPSFWRSEAELLEPEDFKNLNKLLYDTLPALLEQKVLFFKWECIDERKTIHWSRIIIFSLYFICWFYILVTSYWHYPVDLIMGKYYMLNFLMYITTCENPFSELYWGSLNTNMLTPESIKVILEMIITKIKTKFL